MTQNKGLAAMWAMNRGAAGMARKFNIVGATGFHGPEFIPRHSGFVNWEFDRGRQRDRLFVLP